MRLRGVTGLLLAGATVLGAACGTSSAHAGSTTQVPDATTQPATHSPTTQPVTTTTRVNPAAADQLAQFVLTSALGAAKSIYAKTYDFTAVSPASLAPLLPNVSFAELDHARDGVVGVLAQDEHDVFMVTRSASGRWFCITDNNTDGVSYGSGATFSAVNSNGECQQPAWP